MPDACGKDRESAARSRIHGRLVGFGASRRSLAVCAVLCVTLSGCNRIDLSLGRHASISHMTADTGSRPGEIDCWLTLEFAHYPPDSELRDVRVRFESIALAAPITFDWDFIASHDKRAERGFGDGREAAMTNAADPPPLGQPTTIRFPLQARPVIENPPATLYLEAELYWGGVKQDSIRRAIEHVYARETDPLWAPPQEKPPEREAHPRTPR